MRTLSGSDRWLALLLAGLAGYVDSLGFLHLGGVCVSFMSGNTTRMAVGLAGGSAVAAVAAGLIVWGGSGRVRPLPARPCKKSGHNRDGAALSWRLSSRRQRATLAQ